MNLNQISQLFEKDKSVISTHIKSIFSEGELDIVSTVAKNATVQIEGNRRISRNIEYYNLDIILAVGYRVSSKKGTLFRRWATERLNDYLIKGYAINEKRLAQKQLEVEYLKTGIRKLHHQETFVCGWEQADCRSLVPIFPAEEQCPLRGCL